ncbi:MAG: hypothetical protein DI533_06420 [Cereibacter sphaeroides]|uniref:SWI2/SNF2 ATPase domain-containing protein n=1 Tax=Cereibacter sphaeroides TaxID=1063 RepID=A0A2W5SB27_CERSP|nr:MAG: hypothetical protein DI533_06420 [Cereibacter sphaeroides]
MRKACDTILAVRAGDGKGGIWHTQGLGKSLLMTFLAGRIVHHPAMENPTFLVLTGRNDLDNQMFATFARCKSLLGEEPVGVIAAIRREGSGVAGTTAAPARQYSRWSARRSDTCRWGCPWHP